MLIRPECHCGIFPEDCDYHRPVAKTEEFWSHVGFQARPVAKAPSLPEGFGYSLNCLADVLQPELSRQSRRTAYISDKIYLVSGGRDEDSFGKNAAFDVGQHLPPAITPWVTYRSSFLLSEQQRASLKNPVGLRDAIGYSVACCHSTIMAQIECDMLTSSGTDANDNPTIQGLFGGAISANMAPYLGISPSHYPDWSSTVLANGGVDRFLTLRMLEDAEKFLGHRFSDVIVSRDVYRKWQHFFVSPEYSAPSYKERPVTVSPLVPARSLAFVLRSGIKAKQLKRVVGATEAAWRKEHGVPEQATEPSCLSDVKPTIVATMSDGGNVRISVRVTIAAAVVDRKAQALITDIAV